MTAEVCLTVDVEDWYDGMAVLGDSLSKPVEAASGLAGLSGMLDEAPGSPRLTFFVVANYASTVRSELEQLVARGHEIGSHGPDHGRLPEDPDQLLQWLRDGREALEEVTQGPVRGFRSPRFDVPDAVGLTRFRDLVGEAGFDYVSDTHVLGASSPVREIPVLSVGGFPLGGGSYQRLLPAQVVTQAVGRTPSPAVLYYHSYDFGATLPGIGSIRSLAMAKQLIGRSRVPIVFSQILRRFGSKACSNV